MRRGFLVPKLECEYCLNSRSKDEWNHRYDSNAFKFILMRACIFEKLLQFLQSVTSYFHRVSFVSFDHLDTAHNNLNISLVQLLNIKKYENVIGVQKLLAL